MEPMGGPKVTKDLFIRTGVWAGSVWQAKLRLQRYLHRGAQALDIYCMIIRIEFGGPLYSIYVYSDDTCKGILLLIIPTPISPKFANPRTLTVKIVELGHEA